MSQQQSNNPNDNKEQLDRVIESLNRVNSETKQIVFKMAQGMNEIEIVRSFNQKSCDLFTILINLTKKYRRENDYNVSGYKVLFENAIKIRANLPVDKFTLMILEYAPEIYERDENCFLKMTIPDKKVTLNNEFGVIRSEKFKDLWKVLVQEDKENIADEVTLLTTFAHAYLYKTLLKNSN